MVVHVNASVIDNGLSGLKSNARYLYICSQEPTSYLEASSTYALGIKDAGAGGIFPAAMAAGINGRKVTTLEVRDGAVTAGSGIATNWAITDAANLLVVGALSRDVPVPGARSLFQIAAIDITVQSQ
jgi:hypothetical protein